jgi:membrane protein implicated in regulation of membrane protease activity
MHRSSALFSHIVQVVVPFALFAPQPFAAIAGGLIILHQLVLIVSGNYSWLNWLTVVLGIAAFSDRTLGLGAHAAGFITAAAPVIPRPLWFEALLWAIAAMTAALSIQPALNLLSKRQAMNRSYNRFQLVNAYGAFGSVGRKRYELVIEGTADRVLTSATRWQEYGFKAKPGDPMRRPPQIAPWHLRLDWLIWFIPFSIGITSHGIQVGRYDIWFVRFILKLLAGDRATLRLMGTNPFPDRPPAYIRALLYDYRYTTPEEKRDTGAWWVRQQLGVYLPAISVKELEQR